MEENVFLSQGFRFSVTREGREVGHAYLYLIRNDFHPSPFGLLEDVFVDHYCRGQGIATELVSAVLAKARSLSCYKLLATSRTDGTRDSVHAWYKRMGFADYGTEFRINL